MLVFKLLIAIFAVFGTISPGSSSGMNSCSGETCKPSSLQRRSVIRVVTRPRTTTVHQNSYRIQTNQRTLMHYVYPKQQSRVHYTYPSQQSRIRYTYPSQQSRVHYTYPTQQSRVQYSYPTQQSRVRYTYPIQQNRIRYTYPSQQNRIHYTYPSQQSRVRYTYPNQKNNVQTTNPRLTSNQDRFGQECLAATNNYRRRLGLSPLRYHPGLTYQALRYSQIQNHYGVMSHHLDGAFNRCSDAGLKYGSCAENIHQIYGNGYDIVKGWIDSSGHEKNIRTYDMKYMGCAISGRFSTQILASG